MSATHEKMANKFPKNTMKYPAALTGPRMQFKKSLSLKMHIRPDMNLYFIGNIYLKCSNGEPGQCLCFVRIFLVDPLTKCTTLNAGHS